jgi:hypothetical protein
MEESIQHLREVERLIVKDLANANKIVEIKKVIKDNEKHKDLRIAAIHCLRLVISCL